MKKNPHAQALGKLSAGIPRKTSPEVQEQRRKQLAEVRKKRWLNKGDPNNG